VPTWLIVVLAVLLVLVLGGALARRAQLARTRDVFHASLERANRDLAAAAVLYEILQQRLDTST
jgi:hypothetical protein